MKFEKFVKSLASSGIIYERKNGERYLASPTVLMRIPNDIKSITGLDILPLPDNIEKIITSIGCTEECHLSEAIMPYADGKIKDCIRVYRSLYEHIPLAISNDDYSLIDKKDSLEILYSAEPDEPAVGKALLIKEEQMVTGFPRQLLGIIFPTDYDI